MALVLRDIFLQIVQYVLLNHLQSTTETRYFLQMRNLNPKVVVTAWSNFDILLNACHAL